MEQAFVTHLLHTREGTPQAKKRDGVTAFAKQFIVGDRGQDGLVGNHHFTILGGGKEAICLIVS